MSSVQSYGLAVLSGFLLIVSFVPFGHPAFGWIGLVPLLVVVGAASATLARDFRLGLVSGAVFFTGTVSWTGDTVRTFGGLSPVTAVAVAGLLILYLALFSGLVAAAVGSSVRRFGPRALWLTPAFWVAGEVARTHIGGGFPWLLLGYSQATVIPVVQLASLVGVYGLSGLVAAVAAGVAVGVRGGTPGHRWAAAAPAILVMATAVWGYVRVTDGVLLGVGRPVDVALVQGNVPQEEKWDPQRAEMILARYVALTREAAQRGASLVLWPESAVPFPYADAPEGARIAELVRETGVRLLFGSNEVQRSSPPAGAAAIASQPPGTVPVASQPAYYNSAYLLGEDGSTVGVYRKMRLVPFGEFVPFRSLLFFVAPMVTNVGGFSPGEAVVALPLAEGVMTTAICYEIVYPGLSREAVRAGSQLLTTITNDAWYGDSAAPHQHFLQASLRAVEQGRYLLRAANTGISGIVDPYGRVLARSGLFETTVVTGTVRLIADRTVYARIGDVFAQGCVGLTVVVLVWLGWSSRRRRA